MRITRFVAALVLLAACGESKQEPEQDRPAAVPTPPPAAPVVIDAAPPAAVAGPTDYTLSDGDVNVRVTLTPPPGWNVDAQAAHLAMNNGDVGAPAWVKILLTCHGTCGDAAVLNRNIEKVATERFDFTKSDSFVPRLAPVWDRKPAPLSPGVVRWAFHGDAVSGEDWNLHQIATERILEPPSGARVLECVVETTRQPKALEDQLVKLCTDLPVVVGGGAPAP